MKKYFLFLLLILFTLCSCGEKPSDDQDLDGSNQEQTSEDFDSSTEDEKKDDLEENEDSDDKVYDDDINWGPLT